MQLNNILFALSIITFILAAVTSSVTMLHGGVWLAVASVVLYAGLPVWWALPAVAVTALVHLVVRFWLSYRQLGLENKALLDNSMAEDGVTGAAMHLGRLERAKMALSGLFEPATGLFRRRSQSVLAPEAQEE